MLKYEYSEMQAYSGADETKQFITFEKLVNLEKFFEVYFSKYYNYNIAANTKTQSVAKMQYTNTK